MVKFFNATAEIIPIEPGKIMLAGEIVVSFSAPFARGRFLSLAGGFYVTHFAFGRGEMDVVSVFLCYI